MSVHLGSAVMTQAICGIVALVALVITIRAWRGRRVGDHPYCRQCGFDLFGKPEGSDRCPECGKSLLRHNAIVTGQRQRRVGMVLAAAGVVLVCGLVIGAIALDQAGQVRWIQYRPVGWLVADVQSSNAAAVRDSIAELRRRVNASELSPAELSSLIDRLIAIHIDPAKPLNAELGRLLIDWFLASTLSPAQQDALLIGSLHLRVEGPAQLRKSSVTQVNIDFNADRAAALLERATIRKMSPRQTTLGGEAVDTTLFSWNVAGEVRSIPNPTELRLRDPAWRALADGQQNLDVGVDVDIAIPTSAGVYTLKTPIVARHSFELMPETWRSEHFVAPAELKSAVERSVQEVRLVHDEGTLYACVRLRDPPCALASEIAVRPAGVPDAKWERLGALIAEAGAIDEWRVVNIAAKGDSLATAYDLRIAPSQVTLETLARQPTRVWGDAIERRVDLGKRLADLDENFLVDESLRATMQAQIKLDGLWLQQTGQAKSVSAALSFAAIPATACYDVMIESGDRRGRVGRIYVSSLSGQRVATPGSNYSGHGWHVGQTPPEWLEAGDTVDVVLVPRAEYLGTHPAGGTKPWKGEIRFQNQKVVAE